MKKCYSCGISEEETFLHEGISKGGFVNVCRACYVKNEIPLIGKKDLEKGFEKKMSVRERLMNLSGLKKSSVEKNSFNKLNEKEEISLKELIEKNFKKDLPREKKEHTDLIENFHWIIMRKRRMQKLTQEQFAKKIFEPVIAIEHVERGILPKDYYSLIKKLENALGIALYKDHEVLKFDPRSLASESKFSSGLTISDLRKLDTSKEISSEIDANELNLKKVEEIVGKAIEGEDLEIAKKPKKSWFSKKKKIKSEDISKENIDDILFRR